MINKGMLTFIGHDGKHQVILWELHENQIKAINNQPLDMLDEGIIQDLFALPVIFCYLFDMED